MAGTDLIQRLEDFLKEVQTFRIAVKKLTTASVSRASLRADAKGLHRRWLPIWGVLEKDADVSGEGLARLHHGFEQLRDLSLSKSQKTRYLTVLKAIERGIEDDVLHLLIKKSGLKTTATAVGALLEPVGRADPRLKSYLDEAITCAQNNCFRAAIILAWTAAAYRIHSKLLGLGLPDLTLQFAAMKADSGLHFRSFTRVYTFASDADLEEVPDAYLILMCLFLGWLDASQYGQLLVCLNLRNGAAHPGLYQPDSVKLQGYFADLVQLVFANPAF
jgi:hypothetical protein